ncbi:MAG: hypothetical protein KGI87_02905, partial [Burkholderiales bacterium]|nr:hypothetical protein [Burkholderiales bacterium]
KVLGGIALTGAAVGIYLLYFLVRLPIQAVVVGRHIAYVSPHFDAVASMALYLLATCASPLVSSHRMVRLFGVAAVISFAAAYAFYAYWFISVWCFFAAAMSGIVWLHLRQRKAGRIEPAPNMHNARGRPDPRENLV